MKIVMPLKKSYYCNRKTKLEIEQNLTIQNKTIYDDI